MRKFHKPVSKAVFAACGGFQAIAATLSAMSLVLACLPVMAVADAERRDPTQPAHFNRAVETDAGPIISPASVLNVTEIWISDSQRRAIVNGLTVIAGQRLDDDTQILKILPSVVVVKQRGETKKLYLVPSVKTR